MNSKHKKLPHGFLVAIGVILWAIAVLVISSYAEAQQPVPGVYWDQAEPGRGFPVDYQNGIGSITGYVYDEGGDPLWFLAAGVMTEGGTRLRATADVYEGGQCIGCPYTKPVVVGSLGDVDLQFTAPDAATLRINGTTIQIERQNFGFPPGSRGMLGAWQFIAIASRARTDSVTLVFDAISDEPSGTPGGTGVFVDTQSRAAGECFNSGDLVGTCLTIQVNAAGDLLRAYLYIQRTDRLYGVSLNTVTLEPEASMQGLHLATLDGARARSVSNSVPADMIDALSDAAALVDPASLPQ